MAYNTMVRQNLTEKMIEEGASLVRRLDETGVIVAAAFWFYLDEPDTWTLILTSPDVQSKGPKQMYERLQEVLHGFSELKLSDISVFPSDDPLPKLLRVAIATDPRAVSGIRFSRNTINGRFIEDAYIYRLS